MYSSGRITAGRLRASDKKDQSVHSINPDIQKVGLLYSLSEANSATPIADAKAYLDQAGISYTEQTANTNDEVVTAASALIADGVDAIFTPTDNVIMAAELAIYEDLANAGIPHYTGADSFVRNGAFATCGVNYTDLGTETADLAYRAITEGMEDLEDYYLMDGGIITVNTETAEALGTGFVTAFQQTRLGVPSILAGTVTILAGLALVWFLSTRLGLSIRVTGNNTDMVRASSINPIFTITVGLCVSNALTALSDLSLHLDQSDFVTIIGSNGAGKSTLFNAIAGAFYVDDGAILLDGKDITFVPEHRRSRIIGRLFQDPLKGTAPGMTIEENLALLMATLVTPRILLLDEHTAALDPAAADKVLELTREIVAKENITCLMITHNMKQALELGNRTFMMANGDIVLDVGGEERRHMTVDDLLTRFREEAGHALDNDRILLSR